MSSARPMNIPLTLPRAAAKLQLQEDQTGNGVAMFTAIYVFVIVSRLPELAAFYVRGNAYLALLGAAASFIGVFFAGNLLKGFNTTQGVLLILFTMWMGVATVFGEWRGGSIAVITGLWVKSLIAYFLVTGAVRTLKHAQMMMAAMGWATFLVVAQSIFFGSAGGDRFQVSIEGAAGLTFANANGLALSLALGLPFGLYLAMHGKPVLRSFSILMVLIGMVSILRTGSRGGLLVVSLLFIFVFFRAAVPQKVLLVLGSIVFMAAAVAVIPRSSMERFKTLFGKVESLEAASAAESSADRSELLQESLRITAAHPLFGVGPGNFSSYAAGIAAKKGKRSGWQETHNSYTKVSSETGIPGVMLFASVLLFSLAKVRGVEKLARMKGFERLSDMCFCLFLSVLALTVYDFFDSNPFSFNVPVMAALAASIVPLVAAHLQQANGQLASAVPNAFPVGYWRPNGSKATLNPNNQAGRNGMAGQAQSNRRLPLQNWQTRRP